MNLEDVAESVIINRALIDELIPADVKGKAAAALVRLACEEGVTGTGVKGRGIGLHLFSDFIRKRNGEGLVFSDGGLFVQVGNVLADTPFRAH